MKMCPKCGKSLYWEELSEEDKEEYEMDYAPKNTIVYSWEKVFDDDGYGHTGLDVLIWPSPSGKIYMAVVNITNWEVEDPVQLKSKKITKEKLWNYLEKYKKGFPDWALEDGVHFKNAIGKVPKVKHHKTAKALLDDVGDLINLDQFD